jgi:hypothetical protein
MPVINPNSACKMVEEMSLLKKHLSKKKED